MESLALFYHPDALAHETGAHPERVDRARAIERVLEADGLTGRQGQRSPDRATLEQVARVHQTSYVASLERTCRQGGGALDVDTIVSSGSFRAAMRAAGGAVAAARAVVSGEARRSLSLMRPPGHHARPTGAMGFCLFNNVAIAARDAQAAGVGRVAIVDVDVHHGNGTQESFYADGSVLFVSTHQYPFYPGSGALRELGTGAGAGTTLNIPLPAGCGDEAYLSTVEHVVVPALEDYRPELVLVSLGFDAHWADPLASMQVSIAGYVAMIERLAEAADRFAGGRMALVLEGGYNLDALAYGVLAVARALRGEPWRDPLGPAAGGPPAPPIAPILEAARQAHGLH